MHPVRRLLITTTALVSLVGPLAWPLAEAQAQSTDNRYSAWTPPGAVKDARLDSMVKELDALIREAEKARAADGVFLRDLKALSARYQNPTAQRLLFEDFADNDFQRNPTWSVMSGEYWVEKGYGLRSKVTDAAAPANGAAGGGQISKEQLAISVLGALLQGANKNPPAAQPQPTATVNKPSLIETRTRISNAFSATVELSSWKADGVFEIGITQGLDNAGYRVVYAAGQNARLELVKITSRGRATVDAKTLTALEDQKVHSLVWTRASDGTMSVSVDDKAILNARDESFRDPFEALQLSSQGADVIVKSVQLMGVK